VIRLKYERVRRDLSQDSLGAAAHVPQSDLAQVELGRYHPSREALRRLAAVLGVPSDELLKPVSIAKPEETHTRRRDSAGRYAKAER
jgi:transcriptional regulator with XRE-family HTH domain